MCRHPKVCLLAKGTAFKYPLLSPNSGILLSARSQEPCRREHEESMLLPFPSIHHCIGVRSARQLSMQSQRPTAIRFHVLSRFFQDSSAYPMMPAFLSKEDVRKNGHRESSQVCSELVLPLPERPRGVYVHVSRAMYCFVQEIQLGFTFASIKFGTLAPRVRE